jgi:hypothetical protein
MLMCCWGCLPPRRGRGWCALHQRQVGPPQRQQRQLPHLAAAGRLRHSALSAYSVAESLAPLVAQHPPDS